MLGVLGARVGVSVDRAGVPAPTVGGYVGSGGTLEDGVGDIGVTGVEAVAVASTVGVGDVVGVAASTRAGLSSWSTRATRAKPEFRWRLRKR
jgi:hypothetical protein